jgi:hypothetical protein
MCMGIGARMTGLKYGLNSPEYRRASRPGQQSNPWNKYLEGIATKRGPEYVAALAQMNAPPPVFNFSSRRPANEERERAGGLGESFMPAPGAVPAAAPRSGGVRMFDSPSASRQRVVR